MSNLCGASHLCGAVDLPNVVFTDAGGTSFDIGLITDGSITHYDLYPTVDRWRTQITAIKISSIGAGGGYCAAVGYLVWLGTSEQSVDLRPHRLLPNVGQHHYRHSFGR